MSLRLISLAAAVALFSAPAMAQNTIGIGSMKSGSYALEAGAIAAAVSNKTKYVMRPQPRDAIEQHIPVVDAGQLEFSISTTMQAIWSYTGTGLAKTKHGNLRLVAKLMDFDAGVIVPYGSDIRRIEDFRGKRIPKGFNTSPLFQLFYDAFLGNAGLSWDDVKPVHQIGMAQHWVTFKRGEIDVASIPLGFEIVKDMEESVPGGVRSISLNDGPERLAQLRKLLPAAAIVKRDPSPLTPGATEPVNVLSFSHSLWTNKEVSDQVVAAVVKALHASAADLKRSGELWTSFSPARMYAAYPEMPYHPGALAAYRDLGLLKN